MVGVLPIGIGIPRELVSYGPFPYYTPIPIDSLLVTLLLWIGMTGEGTLGIQRGIGTGR